ncbi:MAG: tetratricopeptide repeat protein [Sphingomonas sp.]|uniref:SPOR domain-containing protein n=1 Tax=Sphingomonas sp. TaxID=28214 RepID=UPI001AFE8373|nr:SPOR domain-containing protein [Sphingomonas sp.]MBO9624604.1 tetratricopeptide repeat protein [Sphingomonas sp.]
MQQRGFLRPLALAVVLATGAGPAFAQTTVAPQLNPDADRLAQEMHVLAADPRNVGALLRAGELSARLGDTPAAFAFFARAQGIDPSNPRIPAGRAMALVRLGRPGEALRLFQTSEARGVPMRDYAADRGFAYDLLGQPLLAQRDYKLALQTSREDELLRRYALSLGITGDVDEAMRELDPLLRKSDRAAWRARAFIMAMNGDVPGAEKIASTMMPGNMGSALTPFFRRLGGLSPADRAFAAHFGELSPTVARMADARMAPQLPPYTPRQQPVQVAQAQPPASPAAANRRSRGRRSSMADDFSSAQASRSAPVRTASAAPPRTPVPTQVPAQAQPQFQPPAQPQPQFQPPAQPQPQFQPPAQPQRPMVQPLPTPAPTPAQTPAPAPARLAGSPNNAVQLAANDIPVRRAPPETQPSPAQPEQRPAASTPVPGQTPLAASAPASSFTLASKPAPEPLAPAPARAPSTPEPQPVTQPAAATPAPTPAPTPPGPARVGEEDSVLASIIANITIPAQELEVVTAQPVDLPPAAATPRQAPAPARVVAATPKPEAPKPDPRKAAPAKPDPKAAAKPDPKAAKKPDPKAKDPAKAEPSRIWVQVASGANEESLPKAWSAAVAKAPAAFKGRSGWSTPVRATNRVLAGPFKTAAEAQSFINALAKAGASGFVFTSEPGQKVTKLPAK